MIGKMCDLKAFTYH